MDTFVKKDIVYNNYLNLYEMIKMYKLTNVDPEIPLKTLDDIDVIIIYGESDAKNRYLFYYFISNNTKLYKPIQEAVKFYSDNKYIKPKHRNYTLTCLTVINAKYKKNLFNNLEKSISDNNPESFIRHRYIHPSWLLCNILKHSTINCDNIVVIQSSEEKKHLFHNLCLNVVDGEYVVNLPVIYDTDPIVIWINANAGDIIYYNGYYRQVTA
jgi:DNA-directed RNA polymerase subunit H (RpoH/RPB5)